MKINSKGGARLRRAMTFLIFGSTEFRPSKFVLAFAAILFFTFGAAAETTNDFDAIMQGRQLAKQLCEMRPEQNLTNTGILEIRNIKGVTSKIPITCEITLSSTNWHSHYEAFVAGIMKGPGVETLTVTHAGDAPDSFLFGRSLNLVSANFQTGSSDFTVVPFANSDFWICDLGLEFFHWPSQKILKDYDMRRGRACKVLQSTNPNPSANGYSRVVSWIDNETLGIVHAEAYDAKGKLLKIFDPKSFKKVNGQWELQDMQIQNVQTGSRTRIEFQIK